MSRDLLAGSWKLEKQENEKVFFEMMEAHASAPVKLMMKAFKDNPKVQIDISINGDEITLNRHLPLGKILKHSHVADGKEHEHSEMDCHWVASAHFDANGKLHVTRQDKAKKMPPQQITLENEGGQLLETMTFDSCDQHQGGTVKKWFKKL